ncbi:hypothetical protein SDC9_156061 [bioreactor metagenome]|uniref:Uncharacterized protein n=1 Tax=bioreactor metagenome TaxID=1076179 RepID=A0A645F582_9ZZZZ
MFIYENETFYTGNRGTFKLFDKKGITLRLHIHVVYPLVGPFLVRSHFVTDAARLLKVESSQCYLKFFEGFVRKGRTQHEGGAYLFKTGNEHVTRRAVVAHQRFDDVP